MNVVSDQRLLTGDIWVTVSYNQKVGYLWDARNVVDSEQDVMESDPALNQENFSSKVAAALGDVSKNETSRTMDMERRYR